MTLESHHRRLVMLAGISAASLGFGVSAAHAAPPTSAPASQPASTQAADSVEHVKQWWKGRITVPGMPLDFVVVFTPKDAGAWSATIDIPIQGAAKLPLTEISLSKDEFHFTLPPPAAANFSVDVAKDGKSASGTMTQRGMMIPVTMERVTEAEAATVGPDRPQTPKPPFPYPTRDVTYRNEKADVKLAGTLSIPQGPGPHPAVLLITGSGAQDRDETLFGHKPFAVLADYLARKGIAVLRVDDRGVGGSTGSTPESTSEDFVGDVLAGVEFLGHQPEIDPKRIALLGHSEGAMIAPMASIKSKDIAAIVLLAPPALPGRDILRLQLAAMLKSAGISGEAFDEQLKLQGKLLDMLAENAPKAEILPTMRELLKVQLGHLPNGVAPSDTELDTLAESGYEQFGTPWMRWFIASDPRPTLKQVRIPVLALIGEKDNQVPPKENIPELRAAFEAAGDKDATVKEMPGLNHLFQEANTGLFQEYATISQTLSPTALDEVATWLHKQFKLD